MNLIVCWMSSTMMRNKPDISKHFPFVCIICATLLATLSFYSNNDAKDLLSFASTVATIGGTAYSIGLKKEDNDNV